MTGAVFREMDSDGRECVQSYDHLIDVWKIFAVK